MRKNLKTLILAALSGATALSSLPPEALAGPMSVAPPSVVGLSGPATNVYYYRRWGYRPHGYWRPHYRSWGYYRPYRHRHWGYRSYYRRVYYGYPAYYGYGYDPAGAMFAGAALGIMGAGLAAATAPRWGYGGWGWGGGWGPGWGWGGWW
ncbi:hypothetical protein [Methylocystis parvus]|uniref:BA14K family protein n=1 Tax=Methylocystis parvus TaxID=134 RepID=A0A6B8M3B1_9HYPH|nr:hypothetical protein F7D14_13285 [Methylocystis parvus]